MRVAVVGAGIFGSTIAWTLAKEGIEVDLYDEKKDIFCCASGINQFRLHRGYHYPRSDPTIDSCREGEKKFRQVYGDSVIDSPHEHYYAIARKNSFLNAKQCFDIWSRHGLKYKETELETLDKKNIEKCVAVEEAVFDPKALKEICLDRIKEYGVNLNLGQNVSPRDLEEYNKIVVATYTFNNLFTEKSPSKERDYQFELIEKVVLNLPERFKNQSIVVIDGPFTCIDPFGRTEHTLMGNVREAIHYRNIGKFPQIPEEFGKLLNRGVIPNPNITNIDRFLTAAEEFFPGIKTDTKHIGSMYTIRTVLPHREHDDARPTLVEKIDDKTLAVFSGKIPTCIDAAEQISEMIKD